MKVLNSSSALRLLGIGDPTSEKRAASATETFHISLPIP